MAKQSKWSAELIRRSHIIKAAKQWDAGETLGFRKSLRYDVIIEGKAYPPKAISALALKLASGETIQPKDFGGAEGGFWHSILGQWFSIFPKHSDEWEDTQTNSLLSLSLEELERRAKEAPSTPTTATVNVTRYRRNPYVRAAAIVRANGECQDCHEVPFYSRVTGRPYLEVHHVVPLARNGEDTTRNTIALCPNCHAKRHDELGLAREEE